MWCNKTLSRGSTEPRRGWLGPKAAAIDGTQALEHAREAETYWEALAQDGLAQSERLKDLLEESALWRAPAGELHFPHTRASTLASGTRQLLNDHGMVIIALQAPALRV